METFLKIAFVICFIGGLVTTITTLIIRDAREKPAKRIKRLASALNTLTASSSGFAFLWLRLLTGVETLVGVLLVFGLIEFAIRQWRPSIATDGK